MNTFLTLVTGIPRRLSPAGYSRPQSNTSFSRARLNERADTEPLRVYGGSPIRAEQPHAQCAGLFRIEGACA